MPDSDLDQPRVQSKKLMVTDITLGKSTGRTKSSYSVAKSSDTEPNTFKDSGKEEGYAGKRVEGKELAAVVADMKDEDTVGGRHNKQDNKLWNTLFFKLLTSEF